MVFLLITSHDRLGNGVNLAVHQKFFVSGEFHDDDTEVCTAKIKGQELALLLAVGKAPDVGWEAFDTGFSMFVSVQSLLQMEVVFFIILDISLQSRPFISVGWNISALIGCIKKLRALYEV